MAEDKSKLAELIMTHPSFPKVQHPPLGEVFPIILCDGTDTRAARVFALEVMNIKHDATPIVYMVDQESLTKKA